MFKEWIPFLLKNTLDKINRILQDYFFVLPHFPEGNEETQSPPAKS